jgi:hypothetical protein
LVKQRPASLEQRYEVLREDEIADEAFRRLQRHVFGLLDARQADGGTTVFRESGRLGPKRLYFYVKPAGCQGFLVERSGGGWLVTGAEKIVARDLFLREEAPLDRATLFVARGTAALPRVKAATAGDSLLAFAVYEQRLLAQLGLG